MALKGMETVEMAMVRACVNNDLQVAEFLLSAKENRSVWRTMEWTHSCCPLNSAMIRGHGDMMRLLVTKGYKVNSWIVASDREYYTVLHNAIMKDNPDMVSLLLELGADVSAVAKSPQFRGTALQVATKANKENIVQILKRHGQVASELSEASTKNLLQVPQQFNSIGNQEKNRFHAGLSNFSRMTSVSMPDIAIRSQEECVKEAESVLIEYLEKQPKLEEQQKAALDDQEKVTELKKEKRRINMEYDVKLLENDREITALQAERTALSFARKTKMDECQKRIAEIESGPTYLTEEAIETLTTEIRRMSATSARLGKLVQEKRDAKERDDIALQCPVCLALPNEVYSCQECDNLVCGDCRPKLKACPSCRQSFEDRPPARNKLAERLIQAAQAAK